jgi:RHS repeat-associated protein
MNRRKTRQLPGGQTENYLNYDATGNLTSKHTFNGANISYTYDPQTDRLVAESGPGFNYGYQYDNAGDRVVMTDETGTTNFNHDERDRITHKNSPFGNITYNYDAHENLTSISSNNINGTNVGYQYDALNRPVTVTDIHRGIQTTSYSYDGVGNLASETLPNNVGVTYTYDSLNHLVTLNSSLLTSNSALAGYNYTLGPAGNRTSVSEVSGRAVSYLYDDLYRLTAETIQSDPQNNNGTIGYGYDNVGNRQSRTSSVAPISGQSFSGQYDSNDRLTAGFGYDNDGNTLTQGVTTYSYDGLDHLTSVSAPGLSESFVCDGDGNKVSQTVNGVTTSYLIDPANLTGYAQVLEELQGGNVNRVYTYGTNRISEDQLISGNWNLSFYGYDGQGSVRYLTNSTGTVTDTYTYDAFGNLISQTGSTPNVFLYDGEQNDSNLGQYYLRARFMNEATGRFQTMDTFEGSQNDPRSLHKYLFAGDEPTDKRDPSGHDDIASVGAEEITETFKLPTGISDGPGQGIFVQGHHVGAAQFFRGEQSHLYFKIVPDNQMYWRQNSFNLTTLDKFGNFFTTLGAGPDSRVFGLLVSGYNRYDDVFDPIDFKFKLNVPTAQQDDFIRKIIAINSSYNQSAVYDVFGQISYNSNSFMSGFFDALGIPKPNSITNEEFPGWNHPLPIGGN